jgi:putative glutamine amidotransferase
MTIAIPGWQVEKASFGIPISYYEFIKNYLNADDIRILPVNPPIFTDIDLLVLPGGPDVNPLRYGAVPELSTGDPDVVLEHFDTYILPKYIEHGIPVFGICRGLQTIGVHYGCSLHQDMWHETNESTNPYEAVHGIKRLEAPKGNVIKVNSRHHQSLFVPEENKSVVVIATHEKHEEHVEAIRIKDKPVVAVQWHPESLNNYAGIMYAVELAMSVIKK